MLAVYPGSFDPITIGHLDIINRASAIFDKVCVVVMINPQKNPVFSAEERVAMIRKTIGHLDNVEVTSSSGLLTDFAEKRGAGVIVKGLRAVSDYEYEFQQALANRRLSPGLETVFLNTSAENMFLSSSVVKQIASFGGDISSFVPPEVCEQIATRLKNKENAE